MYPAVLSLKNKSLKYYYLQINTDQLVRKLNASILDKSEMLFQRMKGSLKNVHESFCMM